MQWYLYFAPERVKYNFTHELRTALRSVKTGVSGGKNLSDPPKEKSAWEFKVARSKRRRGTLS